MLRSHHAISRSPFQNNYNQQSRAGLTPLLLSSDAHYAAVRADLESDAQDLEADSWSLAVDQQYLKKHTKETAKRQDVIYGECDFIVREPPVARISGYRRRFEKAH